MFSVLQQSISRNIQSLQVNTTDSSSKNYPTKLQLPLRNLFQESPPLVQSQKLTLSHTLMPESSAVKIYLS